MTIGCNNAVDFLYEWSQRVYAYRKSTALLHPMVITTLSGRGSASAKASSHIPPAAQLVLLGPPFLTNASYVDAGDSHLFVRRPARRATRRAISRPFITELLPD